MDSFRKEFWLYGAQGLLATSAGLGWSGISAELRSHIRGEIEWSLAEAETEVCIAVSPSNAVTRSGGGLAVRGHSSGQGEPPTTESVPRRPES